MKKADMKYLRSNSQKKKRYQNPWGKKKETVHEEVFNIKRRVRQVSPSYWKLASRRFEMSVSVSRLQALEEKDFCQSIQVRGGRLSASSRRQESDRRIHCENLKSLLCFSLNIPFSVVVSSCIALLFFLSCVTEGFGLRCEQVLALNI